LLDSNTESREGFFNPNISEEETLNRMQIPYSILRANSFNEPSVVEMIKGRPEKYFVFSGREILKELLDSGKNIIHIHPGKLPKYRGSTCPYYSILAGDGWWCTSFIMKPGIDEGELISIRRFPLPEDGVDATRIYDPYIRSELLVDTVVQLA